LVTYHKLNNFNVINQLIASAENEAGLVENPSKRQHKEEVKVQRNVETDAAEM
jgi:hypothetical protein